MSLKWKRSDYVHAYTYTMAMLAVFVSIMLIVIFIFAGRYNSNTLKNTDSWGP